jgi:hypothetical protein
VDIEVRVIGCSEICAERQIFSMFEHARAVVERSLRTEMVETFDGCICVFPPLKYIVL